MISQLHLLRLLITNGFRNGMFFDSISTVVDELFADYLSRPNVRQPILTQYCDGRQVQCPNWMTQWGSKALGDQGYSPSEILRYYYGDDIYINTAEEISGIPSSWPGYHLPGLFWYKSPANAGTAKCHCRRIPGNSENHS